MLDRRAQFHQDVLASNLHAGSPLYERALMHITHEMIARGMDAARAAQQAHATIYLQLQRQAMMLSFVDNFWIMSVVCIGVIPLMFLMKKRQGARAPASQSTKSVWLGAVPSRRLILSGTCGF